LKTTLIPKKFSKKFVQKIFTTVTYPSAYVINSDPSSKPSEHWIAVNFDKNGKGEYVLSPDILGFTDFMNANTTSWVYKKKTLHYCVFFIGQYCVYFILFRCRSLSMRSINSHFSSNLTENDRKVASFISDLYQKHYKSVKIKENIV